MTSPRQDLRVYASWAYLGAFAALGLEPEGGVTISLAHVTEDAESMLVAIEAMRHRAAEGGDAKACENAAATALYLRKHEQWQRERKGAT